MTQHVILKAVVGSKAYGLDTASSDTDRLGIYAAPTSDFWLFNKPVETYTGKDELGDYTLHEAEKFVSLALKCNPTLLELLYMDKYLICTDMGCSLVSRRDDFLSKPYVKNAYLGYMTQQLQRIQRRKRGNETNPKKDAKNARHLWRLAKQGVQLWRYQTMHVKLSSLDQELCFQFGAAVADGELRILQDRITWTEDVMSGPTHLPDKPNAASVETWLVTLRSRMLVPQRGLDFV